MITDRLDLRKPVMWAVLPALLLVGIWLRLNQYLNQVLLNDEWHVLHRLVMGQGPGEMFFTFGHADYSIPLGLLYWGQMHWFGLSELAMRWPMLLSSIAALFLFSAHVERSYSKPVLVVFLAFMALSPALMIYAHTARPYAITLLSAYAALFAFYRYLDSAPRLRWAMAYGACTAITVWLHPISGPFVMAPLVLELFRCLAGKNGRLKELTIAGLVAVLFGGGLLLPPLLADFQALAGKAGDTEFSVSTLLGAVHFWLGTPSLACVAVLGAFATVGFFHLLKYDRIVQSAAVGIVLTMLALLVIKPAWSNHPVTLARYLLPAIPLLALTVASGFERVLTLAGWRANLALTLLCMATGWYLATSPIWRLVEYPNSNLTHSYFQFDFRDERNEHAIYMRENLPVSAFWASLKRNASGEIAVAPFYHKSQFWDSPRWERITGRRVVPAYLSGYCIDTRDGEVPRDSRVQLRNVRYLQDLVKGQRGGVDWLVFNRPLPQWASSERGAAIFREFDTCTSKLRQQLGEPDFEDSHLVAFKLDHGT